MGNYFVIPDMTQADSVEFDYDAAVGDTLVYVDETGEELDREVLGPGAFDGLTETEKREFANQKLEQYNEGR